MSVQEFRGKLLVSIREYYDDDAGERRPGKKGRKSHSKAPLLFHEMEFGNENNQQALT